MEQIGQFFLDNLHFVFVFLIFVMLRKYLRQALLGKNGKLDFKELSMATVWFIVLCVSMKYISGSDKDDINMNLFITLLSYLLTMSGINIASNKFPDKNEEGE